MSELSTETIISDLDPYSSVTYRTVFLQTETSIDTFYTDYSDIEVVEILNVALNKPTTESEIYNSSYTGVNAVDGVISAASRWVTEDNIEHWLEIDLQDEYEISQIQTWTCGTDGAIGWATQNFSFRVELDGAWQDVLTVTNNYEGHFVRSFPTVKASKVRYYVPAYSANHVRLSEISVEALIRY